MGIKHLAHDVQIVCCHAGSVQLKPGKATLRIGGYPIVMTEDLEGATVLTDCKNIGWGLKQCVYVCTISTGISDCLRINGQSPLHQAVTASTLSNPPGTCLVSTPGGSSLQSHQPTGMSSDGLAPSMKQKQKEGHELANDAENSPEEETKPGAVLVLVHGVLNEPLVYDDFIDNIVKEQLPNTWLLKFNWSVEPFYKASDSVGSRANSFFGLSDLAYAAVAKLKEVVARCREAIGTDVPITLLTYSQGTIISLCCLQEGMTVDNWILMGSPLDKEIITSGKHNTFLGCASKNVSGKVINLFSNEDDIAMIKGGIGRFGLPNKICGIGGNLANGVLGNINNQFIKDVDHIRDGSWWTMEWLKPNDNRRWRGPIKKADLISILGSPETQVAVTENFKTIQKFASAGTRNTSWRKIFGDADKDEFEHIFTLTPGMMNGIHFDDKDVAKYEIECLVGACEWQIKSATNSTWDKYVPSDTEKLKSGQKASGNFSVRERDWFIKEDGTVFLNVTAVSSHIAKIRCKLCAIDR